MGNLDFFSVLRSRVIWVLWKVLKRYFFLWNELNQFTFVIKGFNHSERTLEDHEKVYQVYQNMLQFDPVTDKRFIFRKDFRKYEMFRNPQVSSLWQSAWIAGTTRQLYWFVLIAAVLSGWNGRLRCERPGANRLAIAGESRGNSGES